MKNITDKANKNERIKHAEQEDYNFIIGSVEKIGNRIKIFMKFNKIRVKENYQESL